MKYGHAVFYLCLVALFLASPVSGEEAGFVSFAPAAFQGGGWDYSVIADHRSSAAGRWGVGELHISHSLVLDDDPFTLTEDFRIHLPSSSWVTFIGHGNDFGNTYEYYENEAARDARIVELQAAFSGIVLGAVQDPSFGVFVFGSGGVDMIIAPQLQRGVLLELVSCFSCMASQYYDANNFVNEDDGGSVRCYMTVAPSDVSYEDTKTVGEILTCAQGIEYNNTIYDAMGHIPINADVLCIMYGRLANRVVDGRSCKNEAVNFAWAGCFENKVEFGVWNEQSKSRYAIWGWHSFDSDSVLVGLKQGHGTSAEDGEIRSYQFPDPKDPTEVVYADPSSFHHLRVVEQDNVLMLTASEPFSNAQVEPVFPKDEGLVKLTRHHEPSDQPFFKLDPSTVRIDDAEIVTGDYFEWSPGGGNRSSEDCADLLIYCNSEHANFGARAWLAANQTIDIEHGAPFRTLVISGGPNVEDMEQAYRAVFEANAEYNNSSPPDPYRIYPDWAPVGRYRYYGGADSSNVGPLYFAVLDDEQESECPGGQCYSMSIITDVTGDGIADGDTNWIPVITYEQLENTLTASKQRNDGEYMDPEGGFAVFCGDIDEYWNAAPWYPQRANRFTSAMTNRGGTNRGMLKESDFTDSGGVAAMQQAGTDIIVEGLDWLLLFGLTTTTNDFTQMAQGDPSFWSAKRRPIGIGVSCEFFSPRKYWVDGTGLGMISNDLDKTTFAYFIAQLNPGWSPEHDAYCEAVLDQLEAHPAGTPLWRITGAAARQLATEHPEWKKFAAGLTGIGGFALLGNEMSFPPVAVADSPGMGTTRLSLSLGRNPLILPGSTTLRLDLPAATEISLRIYDIRGRLITVLMNGSKSAGTHRAIWNGKNDRGNGVASGLYFARLDASGIGVKTAKVIVLK